MNNIKKSKVQVWTIALSTILCCWNGSLVDSNASEASTKPDIEFHGTLEDHANTAPVESILIGGKYESIPLYQQIAAPTQSDKKSGEAQDIDPKQNKTLINLQDIKSIALQHPSNPTSSSIQVNNKTYIQIIVESSHGTKKKYLVESTRKVTCKEVDKNTKDQDSPTLQSRDINFIHVKKLIIKGHKSNHPYQSAQIETTSKESTKPSLSKDKTEFKNNAAELLHAIEENVKNMPTDNPYTFETMRSTILTLLKSLRDQLQKFLDVIK